MSDLNSARECWQEHKTIRKVAPHVLEDTGGMFVLSPSGDEGFVDDWLAGCEAAGIPAEELTTSEAQRREPLVHPKIGRAFRVPDASCDSFALCGALRESAEARGRHVPDLPSGGRFPSGRRARERFAYHGPQDRRDRGRAGPFVVNAAGPWAVEVGKKAGVEFRMVLSRGAMFAFNGRWTTAIVSRLRPPGDGDIFVPLGYWGWRVLPPCPPRTQATSVGVLGAERVLGETEVSSRARKGAVKVVVDAETGRIFWACTPWARMLPNS